MKLTTHLHLVPRPRMLGAIPSLPQYALMAWCSVKKKSTGATLPLPCPQELRTSPVWSLGLGCLYLHPADGGNMNLRNVCITRHQLDGVTTSSLACWLPCFTHCVLQVRLLGYRSAWTGFQNTRSDGCQGQGAALCPDNLPTFLSFSRVLYRLPQKFYRGSFNDFISITEVM
jgi:hypothetical protein